MWGHGMTSIVIWRLVSAIDAILYSLNCPFIYFFRKIKILFKYKKKIWRKILLPIYKAPTIFLFSIYGNCHIQNPNACCLERHVSPMWLSKFQMRLGYERWDILILCSFFLVLYCIKNDDFSLVSVVNFFFLFFLSTVFKTRCIFQTFFRPGSGYASLWVHQQLCGCDGGDQTLYVSELEWPDPRRNCFKCYRDNKK